MAIAAVFGLYFFGKTTQPLTIEEAADAFTFSPEEVDFDTDVLMQKAVLELDAESATQLESVPKEGQIDFWTSQDRNDIATLLSREEAKERGSSEQWERSGDLATRAFRESDDSLAKVFFLQEAVSSYEKALDTQPNTDTKLKLAKIHTSLTGATMQGVLLLREIVEDDPAHVQANYELGLLSLQSGQNDKALARFDQLIKQEPKFIEPYILKAQILLSDSRNDEAKDVIDAAIANTPNDDGKAVLQEMKERIN